MSIIKYGTAHWEGTIKEGKGTISTESGALKDQPYGFNTRFEGKPGSNPEELLGAAHAACFSMAFSLILGEAGLTASAIDTRADVSLDKKDGGFEIDKVNLTLKARIPGATADQFEKLATKAKEGCPVSKLFKGASITLEATLLD
ncbi:OsmC family protein [Acetobacter sp. AAB5]|uniref:OsmC family protein n=1 Tax=Acetobacter sp. AAB5 TaxID=3418370 RepID=UPI003CE90D01